MALSKKMNKQYLRQRETDIAVIKIYDNYIAIDGQGNLSLLF